MSLVHAGDCLWDRCVYAAAGADALLVIIIIIIIFVTIVNVENVHKNKRPFINVFLKLKF